MKSRDVNSRTGQPGIGTWPEWRTRPCGRTARGRPALPVLILACLLGGVLVWSCAKQAFPPGGPADNTPPFVAEIAPSSGSVSVDLQSEIRIQFSESMKKRTVESGVVVSPPCRWKKRGWKDDAFIMVPQGGLKPETTYLVSVSNKVKDAHGVSMKSTFVTGFSTGDSLHSGMISGSVAWKKMDVEGAVVEIHDAVAVDTLGGFIDAEPVYVTLSGQKGIFEVPFVNTRETYKVFSYIDKDLDSEYDTGEQVGCYAGTVSFDGAGVVEDVGLMICGETLGGSVVGVIDTATVPDTVAVGLSLHSRSDSTYSYSARPDQGGAFEFRCVRPGPYGIEAYFDFDGNQTRDTEDTFFIEIPETVHVESCAEPQEVEIAF